MSLSSEHRNYLAQLGIAERPLTSSVAPKQRQRPTGRPKSAIGVFNEKRPWQIAWPDLLAVPHR